MHSLVVPKKAVNTAKKRASNQFLIVHQEHLGNVIISCTLCVRVYVCESAQHNSPVLDNTIDSMVLSMITPWASTYVHDMHIDLDLMSMYI